MNKDNIDFTKYFNSIIEFETLLNNIFPNKENTYINIQPVENLNNVYHSYNIEFNDNVSQIIFNANPIFSIKQLTSITNNNDLYICQLNMDNNDIQKIKNNKDLYKFYNDIYKFESLYDYFDSIDKIEELINNKTTEEVMNYKSVTTDDLMCSLIYNEINCKYIWHDTVKIIDNETKTEKIEFIIYAIHDYSIITKY